MKRKQSPPTVSSRELSKRSQRPLSKELTNSPLSRIVQQYGLLETIISNLFPHDLLSLALSSKSIYSAMFTRSGSRENLLGKLRCPGRGIHIRMRRHKKSAFSHAYNCHDFVQCVGAACEPSIEPRPCVGCKVTTCDECRIHCVYQSICERPCDPDDLLNFSGFVLLCSDEVPILSPHHLPTSLLHPCKPWQDPAKGRGGPYHDQGFLDVPFCSNTFSPPERVEDVLNLNLGEHSLRTSISSHTVGPSSVLRALNLVAEQRKRWFCSICIPSALAKRVSSSQDTLCQCTLKAHFLDRWLCLRCYEIEEAAMAKIYPAHREQCHCAHDCVRAICLWCYRIISEQEGLSNGRPSVSTNTIVH